MSFYAELKRRNVIRVAVLYLLASWLVLQVTDVLSSLLPVPQWTGAFVFLLLAIGLPLVLVFSWVYELTPDGLRRERDVVRTISITHETARKLDLITIVVAGIAVTLMVVDRLLPWPGDEPATAATGQSPPTDAVPALAPTNPSIAVLPFVNISAEPDQEYFSDGLSEELINLLSSIPELRVAARTSAFSFRGKNVQIPEVARQLNVAHVLEGSVRKSGNRLRISARLVRADGGYQLWSQTYERDLDDIFVVQEEIATSVVAALELKLLAAPWPRGEAPRSPDAYALYLHGRYLAGRGSKEDYARAIEYYQQALQIDPDYALAWAGRASVYSNQAGSGYVAIEDGLARARAAAEQALTLDPTLVEAHVAIGWIERVYDWDWAAAEASLARARAFNPGHADALRNAGMLASTLGRFEEAITLLRDALMRDPLRPATHVSLGVASFYAGRLEEAESAFRKVLELSPAWRGAHVFIGRVLLSRNEAQAALAEMSQETDDLWRLAGLSLAYHALDRAAESDAALAELTRRFAEDAAFQIAEVHAYRGEVDAAFVWLERAYEQRDGGLSEIKGDPLLANLQNDPRYTSFLEKMRLLDPSAGIN